MELKCSTGCRTFHCIDLLIVPYGIEILLFRHLRRLQKLLIVPYGIEMKVFSFRSFGKSSFNRTLWN